MNLNQLIKDKIEELGPKGAAEYFEVKSALIAKWIAGTASPGVNAAQRVLDAEIDKSPPSSSASEDSTGHGDHPAPPSLVSILVPTNRGVDLYAVMSILGSWKGTVPESIRPSLAHFHGQRDTLIHLARNLLAQRFLASPAVWSFWHDADIIAPIGNPKWFKSKTGAKFSDEYAGKSAITELTSSDARKIVSGVYVTRDGTNRIVAHCGMGSGQRDKIEAPARRIVEQPWVGFGCVAVHRRVFEDIISSQPDLAPKTPGGPWGFFNPIDGENCSEDVAFCRRAKAAGHSSYLDLSIVCGHVGNQAFLPGT